MQPVEDYTTVESIFVRHRNCLFIRAQFTPIFTGYYIHLLEHGIRYDNDLDASLKDMLAVLTLHLTARPWAETIAWTANLRAPRVNYFVTGNSTFEQITGRLFTKDVRETDRNLLYNQTSISGSEPRMSMVEIDTKDPMKWVEHYYEQSEQRPAKCYRLEDENYVLIAAQPGYDEEWFESLNAEVVAQITDTEETKVLETRKFHFNCGCSIERILPSLSSWKEKPDELFQGEDSIKVNCPRCGAHYKVTRDDLS